MASRPNLYLAFRPPLLDSGDADPIFSLETRVPTQKTGKQSSSLSLGS